MNIHVCAGACAKVASGKYWIARDDIVSLKSANHDDLDGIATLVFGDDGEYVGFGYFESDGPVAVRLLSRRREPDEKELLKRRILSAAELRTRLTDPLSEGYRLIFSEGDCLPGLIVDSYGDYLFIRTYTSGMTRRRHLIADLLMDLLAPSGILVHAEVPGPDIEKRPGAVETIGSVPPRPLRLVLEGLNFDIELGEDRQTGHYFDQSANRRLFKSMVKGYKVLDAFCFNGAWGMQAASGGALQVTFVDSSADALRLTRRNCAANSFCADFGFIESRCLDFLETAAREGRYFDAVVLDPPAMIKSPGEAKDGMGAYLHLNRKAVRCLHPGGLLVTSTCSRHLSMADFSSLVALAASSQGRTARVIHARHQGPDHPVPPAVPEGLYLKCLFLQVD